MKNSNQNWRGLTRDLFNPQLFSDALFGDDSDMVDHDNEISHENLAFDEMSYADFVDVANEERLTKKVKRKKVGNRA